MKNDEPLISMENAGYHQQGKWLVRGVNLTMRRGEIVTIIGPNGSGKSTSVKMALNILSPSEGSVVHQPNLRIGYVPQRFALNWSVPMTVERLMRLTSSLSAEELDAALVRTNVLVLKYQSIQSLSGGELQRVLMARAIAKKPDILVLDEPVQGVDFSGEIALYELIGKLRDELNCAILLISHDLHIVMAATDQVICLNGHVCCHGNPTQVAASVEFKNLFGARAAAALAVYEHDHDHTHLADGRVKHSDGSITEHCHPDDGHHHA